VHTFFGLGPTVCQTAEPSYATVYHLWADAAGSEISVKFEEHELPGKGAGHFRVHFVNAEQTYPGNVAFRPGGLCALDNSSLEGAVHGAGLRYLSFEARLAAAGPQDSLNSVAVGCRVVDRFGTDWMWRNGNRVYVVTAPEWQPFDIDLADHAWSVFQPDGNHRYARSEPDFSLIVTVILEFGRDNGEKYRPGWGSGTLHVRNFQLNRVPAPRAKAGLPGE
jgi:hypothetical protein